MANWFLMMAGMLVIQRDRPYALLQRSFS